MPQRGETENVAANWLALGAEVGGESLSRGKRGATLDQSLDGENIPVAIRLQAIEVERRARCEGDDGAAAVVVIETRLRIARIVCVTVGVAAVLWREAGKKVGKLELLLLANPDRYAGLSRMQHLDLAVQIRLDRKDVSVLSNLNDGRHIIGSDSRPILGIDANDRCAAVLVLRSCWGRSKPHKKRQTTRRCYRCERLHRDPQSFVYNFTTCNSKSNAQSAFGGETRLPLGTWPI